MATWQSTTHPAIYEMRSIVNEYLLNHERPANLTDEQYAAHVLAELLVLPVMRWHHEANAPKATARTSIYDAIFETRPDLSDEDKAAIRAKVVAPKEEVTE